MKINTAVISEEHRGSLGQDMGHVGRTPRSCLAMTAVTSEITARSSIFL